MSCECQTPKVTREYAREQAASSLNQARAIVDTSSNLGEDVRVSLLVSIASEWRWLHAETF